MGFEGEFSERWAGLALDETLQLPPDATIDSRTLASTQGAYEKTLASPGADDARAYGQSLPRISLAGSEADDALAPEGRTEPDLKLQRVIGEGGMGRVHLAQQRSLMRDVAVKMLKDNATAETRQALLSEARITGFLAHPGIIPVHSLGLDASDRPVLVMKRIEGVPWRDLIRDENNPAWAHWESRTGDRLLAHIEILSQVCNAVHFAHTQGVVHRDIKPENVMLGHFGEVYLVDWGLAIRVTEPTSAQLVGTPGYMAPEMAMGQAVDARTDVYLLGATLHEVLTGSCLHTGDDLRALLFSAASSESFHYGDDIAPALANLCNRATAQDPARRPASADEFRRAMTSYLGHRSSIAVSDAAQLRLAQAQSTRAEEGQGPQELAFLLNTQCAEARFGFEQALESWPGNQAAKDGLQQCLQILVEAHLLRRDLVAAQAQLEVMEEPPEDLERRLRSLQDQLQAEQLEQERLQKLDQDHDESIGIRVRILLYLSFLISVTGTSLGFLVSGRSEHMGNVDTVAVAFAFLAVCTLGTLSRRKQLVANAFNRRIVAVVFVVLIMVSCNRLIGWYLVTSLQNVFLVDLLILASSTAVAGATLSSWILWMCPVYLLGAFATAYVAPERAAISFSIAASLGLLLGLVAWRHSALRQGTTLAGIFRSEAD